MVMWCDHVYAIFNGKTSPCQTSGNQGGIYRKSESNLATNFFNVELSVGFFEQIDMHKPPGTI